MKCRWCGGTGGECGCGEGHCTHCDQGQVADHPFGDGSKAKIADDVVRLICHHDRFFAIPIEERIQRIAQMAANITLTEGDVQKFATYFNDLHRDCTIGDFVLMVAERAEEIRGH